MNDDGSGAEPAVAPEIAELRRTVRAVLARCGTTPRRALDGDDERLWDLLSNQVGATALAIPEDVGGAGASLAESCVVVAELGAQLAATPLLGALIGAQAIELFGDDATRAEYLPELAGGTAIAALAIAGPDGWDAPSTVHNPDGTISGSAHYVLAGDTASVLVVAVEDTFVLVAADDPGVRRTSTPGMDPTRGYTRLDFGRAVARPLPGVTAETKTRLIDVAWTLIAAEQTGAARQCLAMTVDYTKSRVQFGRPIGSFQALKHRMADLYVQVELAESVLAAAIAALSGPAADDPTAATVARIVCSRAFSAVAAECIQLHGGIAITWEHDAHLYFKRAHADALLFGTPAQCLSTISR